LFNAVKRNTTANIISTAQLMINWRPWFR